MPQGIKIQGTSIISNPKNLEFLDNLQFLKFADYENETPGLKNVTLYAEFTKSSPVTYEINNHIELFISQKTNFVEQ